MIRTSTSRHNVTGLADLVPDLTPMLDVIFILLIFFILTANSVQFAIDLDLPEKGASTAEQIDNDKAILFRLYPNDKGWAVNDENYDSFSAASSKLIELRGSDDQKQVVIASDKNVTVDKLLEALSFLREHNIATADIMMKKEGAN